MLSLFFLSASSLIPAEECPKYSNTVCTNCLINAKNLSCGWCAETKSCVPGDKEGPFKGTCTNWFIDKEDAKCIADSSIAFSLPTRIAIGCTSGVIAVIALIFWVFIFPKIFAPSSESSAVRSVVV